MFSKVGVHVKDDSESQHPRVTPPFSRRQVPREDVNQLVTSQELFTSVGFSCGAGSDHS